MFFFHGQECCTVSIVSFQHIQVVAFLGDRYEVVHFFRIQPATLKWQPAHLLVEEC